MKVDYDDLASSYDMRYEVDPLVGVAAALHALAAEAGARRLLEVGCGTGRWLAEFPSPSHEAHGLDLSVKMLREAQRRGVSRLARGQAARLPYADAFFDMVYAVNALHHFPEPRAFIDEAHRLLRSGGALAVIGMDPSTGRDRWYVYDYFEGARQADLRRYPPAAAVEAWMRGAGFIAVHQRPAERIRGRLEGDEILDYPFLRKESTSQLALLEDEVYQRGVGRIKAAVRDAAAAGKEIAFEVNIDLILVEGRLPPSDPDS